MTMTPEDLERVAAELKQLSESLSKEIPPTLAPARATRIRKTIAEAHEKLRRVAELLDPVKQPEFVFDPANPNVVGRIVGITMIARPRKPLETVERFYGSGVYALYYNGEFPPYQPISKREHPIYVGKADPTDPSAKTAVDQGPRLAGRLRDHRRTILHASASLNISDFEYRALVVQSGWQTAAEDYLIHLFKPIWNNEIGICYGFGKHGDDPETRGNLRSPWDTLHHGRGWAHRDPKMKDAKLEDQIIAEIGKHLGANPPLGSIDEILRRFLDEMRAVS